MTPSTNVSFYADPKGLAALKSEARAQDPGALKEVAKQFESLFTQMLLKSMREANKSVRDGESLFGGDQADFYQDMFDQQLAVHLSQGEGLGLADMLVRQLARAARKARGWRPGARGRSESQCREHLQPPPSGSVASSKSDFSARCCRMRNRRRVSWVSIPRRCWRRLRSKPDGANPCPAIPPANAASICLVSRRAATGPVQR